MLRRYKYAGLLAMAECLGGILADRLSNATRPDLLIPVPLHPHRLKERGFNQALEIARVVSKQLHIPLAAQTCARIRDTPHQAGMSVEDRRKNLRGAFDCPHDLSGKSIALLDDVMTTGASLDALAHCVKSSGANHVQCWVVARTLKR
jgi:ComF family protein